MRSPWKNCLQNIHEGRYCVAIETIKARSKLIGVSPSGKAAVFGTAMRRFESFHPKMQPEKVVDASIDSDSHG